MGRVRPVLELRVTGRPNPTGHPARFSPEVLELFAEILLHAYPVGSERPALHDPMAGTGEALEELWIRLHGNDPVTPAFEVGGTEIEAAYIVRPQFVVAGDATDRSTYPNGRCVIVTSPAYPNGIADYHYPSPDDTSKRYTYLKSLIDLTGKPDYDMADTNLGRYGYRGTQRGGRSSRRLAYWTVAEEMVKIWAQEAELVLLNVSDFKHSKGKIEPVVDDWKALLSSHGFIFQFDHPVGTHRMLNSPNPDRADNEVIVEARRGA